MSVVLPKQIKEFVYVDADGIDGLFSQTVDLIEVKRIRTDNRTLSGKVGVAGRLKSMLLAFLGEAEGEASTEVTGSKGTSMSTEQVQSTHNKLKLVIESLSQLDFGVAFSSLSAAVTYSLQHSQKVFFCGRYQFDAPQFYSGLDAQAVSQSGYLTLTCGERYIDSDDYYKNPRFRADMSCSILKMPRSANGMSPTGHDACYFRGYQGISVPLGVFCSVIPIREMVQLKPYAIWV